jgi:hypothetical protein
MERIIKLLYSKSECFTSTIIKSDGYSLRRCHFHPRRKDRKMKIRNQKGKAIVANFRASEMSILKKYWMIKVIEISVTGNSNGNAR